MTLSNSVILSSPLSWTQNIWIGYGLFHSPSATCNHVFLVKSLRSQSQSSLLWLAECVLIRNQRLWGHLTAHVKGTQIHRWSCYAWCKVCALFVACRQWKSKKLTIFLFQWIIKHLIDLVFVIFRETKVFASVISLSFWLQLITPTLTLIILDIIKTSFNNIV